MFCFRWIPLLTIPFFSLTLLATVYGTDDRRLVHKPLQGAAQSVGFLVPTAFIESQKDPTLVNYVTSKLTDSWNLCATEKFANLQSFAVGCTGFLVAPDLMVTAGHCMVNFGEVKNVSNPQCTDFKWSFSFQVGQEDQAALQGIPLESLFECEKVLHAVHLSEPLGGDKYRFDDDFALVQLKKTPGLPSLKLTAKRPAVGEKISLIGYPLGSPMMRTTGKILANESKYLVSNLDAFPGNSGSPVFNEKGEVFGILVRGYPSSIIEKPGFTCEIINRCDENGQHCTQLDETGLIGEHIMPLDQIPELKKILDL